MISFKYSGKFLKKIVTWCNGHHRHVLAGVQGKRMTAKKGHGLFEPHYKLLYIKHSVTITCFQSFYDSKVFKIGITKMMAKSWQIKSDRKWMLLLNNCYKIVSDHFFAICIFIFHKTEVRTVILRCLMGLNLNWFKSYGLKCSKMQIFPFPFFCDFVWKHKFAFFVFLGFVS